MQEKNKSINSSSLKFRTIDDVVTALGDSQLFGQLSSWMMGKPNTNQHSSSESTQRIHLALAVINEIRDTCRQYFDATTTKAQNLHSYDSDFPSLGTSGRPVTKLQGKKKNSQGGKRRIRPASVQQNRHDGNREGQGNLVGLQSQEPLAPSNDKASFPLLNTSIESMEKVSNPGYSTPVKQKAGTSSEGAVAPTRLFGDDAIQDPFTASKELINLIDLFSTILDACLVPSTLLELHFLFRLLGLNPHASQQTTTETVKLNFVLANAQCIRYYARESIRKQSRILHALGPAIWKPLVTCEPFRELLPDLCGEFAELLEAFSNSSSALPTSIADDSTSLLALPFNQERDSRHNFNSSQAQALYHNRENTRDSFLYQLRSFLNVRGKLLEWSQAAKTIRSIERSSRTVVESIHDGNLEWFSNFFCDMLSHIGLTALQETDKELLQITGAEKLQKLHQRFSAKTPSQSKSTTQRVMAKPNRGAGSARSEVQTLFPGHQEFFCLFILSADCFSFNMQLRASLVRRMAEIDSRENKLGKNLLEMRMFARFAGLLFFSPGWSSGTSSKYAEGLDAIWQAKCSGLSLRSSLETAWIENELTQTVPWVVEFLKMSAWDGSPKSKHFTELLSILRHIQTSSAHGSEGEPQLPRLSVESLFADVLGMEYTVKLSQWTPPGMKMERLTGLNAPAWSKGILFDCVPHSEELAGLFSAISRKGSDTGKSPGISRKLRPSILGPSATPPRNGRNADPDPHPAHALRTKLRNTFFHQNPSVREACDFAIPRVLQNLDEKLVKAQVRETMVAHIEESPELTSSEPLLVTTIRSICIDALKSHFKSELELVLRALCSRSVTQGTVSMAASLGTEFAHERSQAVVERLAAAERQYWNERNLEDEKRQLYTPSQGLSQGQSQQKSLTQLVETCSSLLMEHSRFLQLSTEAEIQDGLVDRVENVKAPFETIAERHGCEIPPEKSLHGLFASVFELDKQSSKLVDVLLTSETSWSAVSSSLKLAAIIQTVSNHGLHAFKLRLREPATMKHFAHKGLSAMSALRFCELAKELKRSKVWNLKIIRTVLSEDPEGITKEATKALQLLEHT